MHPPLPGKSVSWDAEEKDRCPCPDAVSTDSLSQGTCQLASKERVEVMQRSKNFRDSMNLLPVIAYFLAFVLHGNQSKKVTVITKLL